MKRVFDARCLKVPAEAFISSIGANKLRKSWQQRFNEVSGDADTVLLEQLKTCLSHEHFWQSPAPSDRSATPAPAKVPDPHSSAARIREGGEGSAVAPAWVEQTVESNSVSRLPCGHKLLPPQSAWAQV